MTRTLFPLAALAVAAAAGAADPAPPSAAPVAAPTVQLAVQGLVRQLQDSLSPARAPQPGPGAEQLAAMDKVFRSRHPVRIDLLPAAGTAKRARLTLPSGSYADAASSADWSDGTLTVERNGDGTRIDATGAMAQLTWQPAPTASKMTMRNVTLASRRERGPEDLWLGPTHVAVDTMRVAAPGSPEVEFTDARVNMVVGAQGNRVDERYEMAARSAKVGGVDRVTDLHLAMRFRNLDPAVLRRLLERRDGDKALVVEQWKQLALSGAELDIEDLSARYNGHKAWLSGTIAMPGSSEDDFGSVARVLRKLALRFEVTVPLALVRDAAVALADKYAGKTARPIPPAELQDALVNKAVTGGYARVDGDVLRSTIEWQGGALRINGNPVALPAPARALLVDVPPADTGVPRRVAMADRQPDDVLSHALNGNLPALAELCRVEAARGAAGTEAALKWCGKAAAQGSADGAALLGKTYERTGDAARAAQWRRTAAERTEAARLARAALPPRAAEKAEAGGVELHSVPGGQWDDSEFRFDATRRRDLVIDLSSPRGHGDRLAALGVCVQALAPSDRVCLALMRPRGEEQLIVAKRVHAPGDRNGRLTALPAPKLPVGVPQRLRVFVRDDVVYFELNGQRLIAEPVTFPVEALWLDCASADCRFRFTAGKDKGN